MVMREACHGTSTMSDCVAVLPLDKKAGGHRLGVNGLAVDEDNSILCGVFCQYAPGYTDSVKDTLVAVTARFVLGT